MKKTFKIIILSLLLLFLIFIIISKGINFYEYNKIYSKQKDFKENQNITEIQDWMNPFFISREFHIPKKSMDEILGKDISFKNKKKPLKELCYDYNLDCNEVIKDLSKEIKSGN